MNLLHRGLWALTLTVPLLLSGASLSLAQPATQTRATATPLASVPQEAALMLRLKAPNATIERVSGMLNAVQPGLGGMISGQAVMVGQAISNPTLDGVNMDGDFWAAAIPQKDAPPSVVFMIPATDVQAMEDAIDARFTFLANGGWGIYSEDAAAIEAVKACLAGSKPSVMKLFSGPAEEAFGVGDLSLVLNMPTLRDFYRNELDEAKTMAEGQIGMALEQAPETGGINAEGMGELASKAVECVFRAIDESEVGVISLTTNPSGLVITEHFGFGAGTTTGAYLAQGRPTAATLLGNLPVGALGYLLYSADLAELNMSSMKMVGSIMTLSEEQQQAMTAAAVDIESSGIGPGAISFDLTGDDEGAVRSVSVFTMQNPGKFKQALRALMPQMGNMKTNGMEQTSELKADAETAAGTSVDVVTVTQKFDVENNPVVAETQQAMMSWMYGTDGMVQRFAYLGDRMVQTLGGGSEAMAAALEQAQGSGGKPAAELARDMQVLPGEANVYGMVDLVSALVKMLPAMQTAIPGGLPIPADAMDGLELPPSFVGFAAQTTGPGITTTFAVPVEQIQSGMQVFQHVQGQGLQGGGQF